MVYNSTCITIIATSKPELASPLSFLHPLVLKENLWGYGTPNVYHHKEILPSHTFEYHCVNSVNG